MEISAASYGGYVRQINEDMILVGAQFVRDSCLNVQVSLGKDDRYMMAIADGMGGCRSGDVASEEALRSLHLFYHGIPEGLGAGDFNEAIVSWLDSVNLLFAEKGRSDQRLMGMGTTLVGLAYYEDRFYSLNCGDSRLYKLHEGRLIQLTADHSLSNMLGLDRHTSIVTNCIGAGCSTSYIDVVQINSDVSVGDTYLLCSDGLTDMLPDGRIGSLLEAEGGAEELCEAAIAEGGLDNISCCVINIK